MASTARLDELKKKFDENPRRYFAPLANEHRKSGDLDQAIALCRTHLPQQPGHISGHIVLAQALYEAGSLDESREIFHTALGLDPENLIALRYLGDIARDTADVETARSWYQRVLEVDPRNDEIAQLVRDLDAPRAEAVPTEQPAAAAPASFAPPAPPAPVVPETPAAPAPQANNDARFAPLPIEEIDLEETLVEEATPTPAESETARAEPQANESHTSWDMALPEVTSFEPSGSDPFDLGSGGGADALFDVPPHEEAHDFFLTELSGANAPQDGREAEASSASSDAPEAWAPEPAAAPQEPVAASPSADSAEDIHDITAFEEGAFYLEPPPAAPSETPPASAAVPVAESEALPAAAAAEPTAPNNQSANRTAGMDAFAAEYYAPVEPGAEMPGEPAFHAAEPPTEPNAEPMLEAFSASLPDVPTAEWQQPQPEPVDEPPASSQDALGLEVMEFIPPSNEQQPASTPRVDALDVDPALGHTPPMTPSEPRVAPAAFVTETMAELYLQQGFRNEALEVYRELLARNPSDDSLRERIAQIESGSISSVGMAMVSENVVESALRRQSARPARSVRSFFASLASRRAPVQPVSGHEAESVDAPAVDAHGDAHVAEQAAFDAPANAAATSSEAAPSHEPERIQASIEPPVSEPAAPARPDRITPLMSAAETLATFDPFADTVESDPWAGFAPNDEAVAAIEVPAAPTLEPIVARAPTPAATPVIPAEEPPARRTLEDLFPDTPVTARTEVAAQTFATAFGRPEPQGRPTRAASSELSLDHVFRGAPEGAPPADGGFSFDQFFSDSRTTGGDASTPASTSDAGRGSGSNDAHDIEQFTAWLEGLKKK